MNKQTQFNSGRKPSWAVVQTPSSSSTSTSPRKPSSTNNNEKTPPTKLHDIFFFKQPAAGSKRTNGMSQNCDSIQNFNSKKIKLDDSEQSFLKKEDKCEGNGFNFEEKEEEDVYIIENNNQNSKSKITPRNNTDVYIIEENQSSKKSKVNTPRNNYTDDTDICIIEDNSNENQSPKSKAPDVSFEFDDFFDPDSIVAGHQQSPPQKHRPSTSENYNNNMENTNQRHSENGLEETNQSIIDNDNIDNVELVSKNEMVPTSSSQLKESVAKTTSPNPKTTMKTTDLRSLYSWKRLPTPTQIVTQSSQSSQFGPKTTTLPKTSDSLTSPPKTSSSQFSQSSQFVSKTTTLPKNLDSQFSQSSKPKFNIHAQSKVTSQFFTPKTPNPLSEKLNPELNPAPISTTPSSTTPTHMGEFKQTWTKILNNASDIGNVLPKNISGFAYYLHLVDETAFAATCMVQVFDNSLNNQLEPYGVHSVPLKSWVFPISEYNTILAVFKKNNKTISELPATLLEIINSPNNCEKLHETKRMELIPATFSNILLPFQKEGIQYVLKHSGRALIGDEMGLGKTFQAIGVALCYRDEWPVLIIVPSSLRCQWADTFADWAVGAPLNYEISSEDINIVKTAKSKVDKMINIISYNIVSKIATELLEADFQVVICDESHYLKTWSTQRTKAITPILKKAKRAILLTGTPALSRPIELFTQLQALAPKTFPTVEKFALRYCNRHRDHWGRLDDKGSANLLELHYILRKLLMIRRKKDQVLTELPSKFRQKISIDLDKDLQKYISGVKNDLKEVTKVLHSHQIEERDGNFHQLRLINELFRGTGRAKLPSVLNYIKETFLEEDPIPKFVIFAKHQDVLDSIEHELTKHNVRNIRICGKTKMDDRKRLIDSFQEDVDCKAAVLSIGAAGVGITLTAAAIVVFAEMDWTPGNLFQAEDRCHRIGQTSTVTIQYLVAKGTVDDIIWEMINKKLAVIGTALDGDEDKFSAASMHSDVSTKIDNEMVSLVLEKVDNYEARKARMQRKAEIRNNSNLEPGYIEDDDFDLEVNPLEEKKITPITVYKPKSTQKIETPTTPTPTPALTPAKPFTPEIHSESTSRSRLQKFRYSEKET